MCTPHSLKHRQRLHPYPLLPALRVVSHPPSDFFSSATPRSDPGPNRAFVIMASMAFQALRRVATRSVAAVPRVARQQPVVTSRHAVAASVVAPGHVCNASCRHQSTDAAASGSRRSFIGKELLEPTLGHIGELFEHNKGWAAEMVERDPEYFERLGKGQQPRYLFIGCADSRVAANEILGLGAGEVFVHRNIANMVVGGDLSVRAPSRAASPRALCSSACECGFIRCGVVWCVWCGVVWCGVVRGVACTTSQIQSVIEYGVEHLGVEDIIVCGHYGCGGVHGASL